MASGFWNNVSDMAGDLLGNIEKAVIAIQDKRERTIEEQEAVSSGPGSSALDFTDMTSSLDKLKDVAEKTRLSDSVMTALGVSSMIDAHSTRIFTVQFNPAELQFTGYGGGHVQKMNFGKNESKASFGSMKARITMSVKLIFDQVDPQDAFMSDKFTASYTAIGTGIAKGAMKLMKKKSNTVQQQIEGFIGAIRNCNTREITFAWGNLCYTGLLNRVSTQYTMFNVNGEPIRGIVNLTIVCSDETITEDRMGDWEEQYEKAFGGKSKSYVNAAQKVGNIFNFSL